jgi:pimeloyl-ACP methyl ester carboxylesterase
MMAADYRHIGGRENRLGRHYSRFATFRPAALLAAQSLENRETAGRIGEVGLKPRRLSSRTGGARHDGRRKGAVRRHVAFSQTDFTEDFKKITVPVLVMHSEDDQIVPDVAAGPLSAELLKNGTLKAYKSFPHGMPTTEADTINSDLLAFIKS